MSTCRSCVFFGGKAKSQYSIYYKCLHPMLLQLTGGRLDNIKRSCVLYGKRGNKKEEEK